MNLLNNAIEAINQNGQITIKTRNEKDLSIIEITDSGSGIPEDIIGRITDPFFTTKDPGKGTGLGLSITQNIILEHKGKIEFESKINSGTTARVVLPTHKTHEQ